MTKPADTLGLEEGRLRARWICVALVILLVLMAVAGIAWGSVAVPIADVIAVIRANLTGDTASLDSATNNAVIWEIRTPRVILGALAGAGLAVAGLIMQTLVRNVLADPYVIGINSGASSGAAAAILFGFGAVFGDFALQASAFVGAFLASLLIFFVARSQGSMTSIRLLMAGVAVGYALTALTNFMVFGADTAEGSRSVMFWTLGSLGLANWNSALVMVAVVVFAVCILLWLWSRRLDVMAIGDETALTLGINPTRFRMICLAVICVLIGSVVAMVGSIGFIGLVVPHLARRMVGGSHRYTIPVSALLGAILLLLADLGARTLLAPQEIPIGIITALVGAPLLLVLVRRMYSAS